MPTQSGASLPELISRVNNMVHEASSANRYATFFYAEYNPQTRAIRYVNAGHNAPFVVRPSGADFDIFRWDAGGPVIGLLPEAHYQQGCFELLPGDLILLYTDGVSESMDTQDEEWGEESLIACAKACCGVSAREVLDRLMRAAVAFAAGAPQHDDMTLVVLRVVA